MYESIKDGSHSVAFAFLCFPGFPFATCKECPIPLPRDLNRDQADHLGEGCPSPYSGVFVTISIDLDWEEYSNTIQIIEKRESRYQVVLGVVSCVQRHSSV